MDYNIEREYDTNDNLCHETYFFNNTKHREGGPAEVYLYPSLNARAEYYYIEGKLHREDGPAMVKYLHNEIFFKHYYYNDILVDENIFNWCISKNIPPTKDIDNIPEDFQVEFKLKFS